jgi:multiple sugar transport system permease protein
VRVLASGLLDTLLSALYLGHAARSPPAAANEEAGMSGARQDLTLAIAFIAPYAALFLAFALYPIGYALWMGSKLSLYTDLIADPLYLPSALNTALFVGVGVNVKMFLALLLSGFFMQPRWWIRALLVVYVLPWTLPAIQTAISFRWMLSGEEYGLVNRLLSLLLGIDGPIWFNHWGLALGSNIVFYVWKWMPFWTLIFLAGRMAIPRDVSDAATVDGATGVRRFVHVTFPLLANLYLVCTLLSIAWTMGEFTTVYFVSGGAPVWSTQVLTTLGFHYAFDVANPSLAVAAVMSVLPVLVPVVVVLLRKVEARTLQL